MRPSVCKSAAHCSAAKPTCVTVLAACVRNSVYECVCCVVIAVIAHRLQPSTKSLNWLRGPRTPISPDKFSSFPKASEISR